LNAPATLTAPRATAPRDCGVRFAAPLLYVGWADHLMFGAPVSLCLSARTPFAALCTQVLPGIFGSHPDFSQVNWDRASWTRAGQPWQPDPGKTLAQNGLTHKDLIEFRTPGLRGIGGSGS